MSNTIILEQHAINTNHVSSAGGIKRKRVYIFPPQQGFIYTILLLVMLIGAVNYTNSMAYLLTFMLGSLFMVCMLHTYRNLRGLVISTVDAPPVFADDHALFPITFDNRSGPERVGITIAPYGRWWTKTSDSSRQQDLIVNIKEDQLYRNIIRVPTARRGYLQLSRLRIRSTYPLGLFRAWSYMECSNTCIVYPKPIGISKLPLLTENQQEDQSGNRTGTDDFTGFKQYRAGDSIRNIDWKILAREQGLLIKQFSGSGSQQLVLSWSQTSHLQDVETRLSQLSLWMIEVESNGFRYGLEMPDSAVEIGYGEIQQHLCLKLLATYGLEDKSI